MTLALALARSTMQFVSDFFFHVHLIIVSFTHMNIIKRACTGSGRGPKILPGHFAPRLLFRKPPFIFPGYAPVECNIPHWKCQPG